MFIKVKVIIKRVNYIAKNVLVYRPPRCCFLIVYLRPVHASYDVRAHVCMPFAVDRYSSTIIDVTSLSGSLPTVCARALISSVSSG